MLAWYKESLPPVELALADSFDVLMVNFVSRHLTYDSGLDLNLVGVFEVSCDLFDYFVFQILA